MKRTFAALALATACTPVLAEDLLQVYRDALANDAQFAAARAQLQAGQEAYVQGRAGILPNISANAGTSWNYTDFDSPVTAGRHYNSNSYALQLSQPLFDWRRWVEYRQGELRVGLAEAQYQTARQDLILRAAQAYFEVLYAQDALAAVQALRLANGEQLAQAKKSFEVGTVTITDVHEAQSRYDLAVAQEAAAQSQLEVNIATLRQVIGKEPGTLAPLRAEVKIQPPEPNAMQPWVDQAEKANYNVQAQELNYQLAEREIERSKAGHLPTLDLVASTGHQASGASFISSSRSDTSTVGLQLTVPIFQGGFISSRVRETVALKEQARSNLEGTRRNAALSARQAYLGVTSGIAQVKGYEAALTSSQSSVEANKLGYDVGVRINIDVLNAQSQLADTQQRLARARYDTLISQLQLKSAAGSLSEDDIAALNALLAH